MRGWTGSLIGLLWTISSCGSPPDTATCSGSCVFAHGTGKCDSGACVLAACDQGFGDCDGSAANGCEVDLASNSGHCGACGMACADRQSCATGECHDERGCTPRTCTPAHAFGQCVSDACVVQSCEAGYADCNGRPADGCEVSTDVDPDNCGQGGVSGQGCGVVCSKNHVAVPKCGGGVCNGVCDSGYLDCDGNMQKNGCELPVFDDVKNCGDCGLACSPGFLCSNGVCVDPNNCPCDPPHAQGQCLQGRCVVVACDSGFGDCNGNPNDGCEVDLNVNFQNCGECARACLMGQLRCAQGVCQ